MKNLRLHFKSILLAGLFTLLLCFKPLQSSAERKSTDKPNIIVIFADDMGWSDAGYKGLINSDFFETPHIDRLAREGMIFNRFYPSAANCAPSRASLLTGMFTPRHHVYVPSGASGGGEISAMRWKTPTLGAGESFHETFHVSYTQVDPEFESLAEMLKRAGYVSARLGKWHIGDDNQGFDLSSAEGTPNYVTNFYGNEQRFYTDTTVAERLTDLAIDFIHQNRENPFFVYLSHWEPHGPQAARKARIEYFENKFYQLVGRDEMTQAFYDSVRRDPADVLNRATYAAMIEQLDISTGRVLAALEAFNLDDNTVVMFTSDNGSVRRNTSNYPLRAGKGSFYEGGIRTPFAIRWPGVIEPGTVSEIPINGVDLMPTFAEMAGVSPPKHQPYDGLSILPLLTGNKSKFDHNRSLFFHFPLYTGGNRARYLGEAELRVHNGPAGYWRAVPLTVIMNGDYKLIYYYEYDSYELFNLKKDISEEVDLSGTRPEVERQLLDELHSWVLEVNAPVPNIPNPYFDPDSIY